MKKVHIAITHLNVCEDVKNETWKNSRYQEKVNEVLNSNMNKLDKDIGNVVLVLQKRLTEGDDTSELSERIAKIERMIEADREDVGKNMNSYMSMIKSKYEALADDLKAMSFISQGVATAGERSANELFNKINNHTLNEVKDRLLRLEVLTSDYIKGFVEPEAQQRAIKIAKQYILIDEKFECLLFLIKNYKLLPPNMLRTSIQHFRDAIGKANFK